MKKRFSKQILLFLLFPLAVLATMQLLNAYTNHNEEKVVPNLLGMTIDKTTAECSDNDLLVEVADSQYMRHALPNTVVKQRPEAGAIVKPGRKIYVTLASATPTQIKLPHLQDLNPVIAHQKLEGLGLNSEIIEALTDTFPIVFGFSQNGKMLRAGDLVDEGSTIDLLIGVK